ncbi:MAG: type II secretion system minor pseudopilin GspI [Pseudomonadales bacterium]
MNSRMCRGFTLVEIMIALAIFAVVSSALIKNVGMAAKQAGILQERTLAYWVAENHLNRLRLDAHGMEPVFPGIGTDRQTVTMADREWTLQVDIESTDNELVRRIEVDVMTDGTDRPLATLTGFIGRY